MDGNALMVQMMIDRQADITNLRAEVERLTGERDAYEAEVERLRAVIADAPTD